MKSCSHSIKDCGEQHGRARRRKRGKPVETASQSGIVSVDTISFMNQKNTDEKLPSWELHYIRLQRGEGSCDNMLFHTDINSFNK